MVPFDFGDARRNQPAHVQGIREKAADGIRTHDLLHGNYAGLRGRAAANMAACRGFVAARQTARDQQYAWICADMQRFGNFGAEVPETRGGGSIFHFRPPADVAHSRRRFS
jgi:hypothetical protein